MYQLISSVNYIHKMGYAHRDIKTDNIILDLATNRLKLIDFGLACNKDCSRFSGTFLWFPPEMLLEASIFNLQTAQAHDIWSLGLVLYYLANIKFPFYLYNDLNKQKWAILNVYKPSNYLDKSDPNLSRAINDIINSALTHDWKERPTARQLLDHMEDQLR